MAGLANKVVGGFVALIVVCAVGAYAFMQMGAGGETSSSGPVGMQALVHDSDGVVHVLDLSQDQEESITTSLGTNVVVVEDGAVFVREADCDNHDCIHQGKLTGPGKQIICLPHKLWIEVVVQGEQGAADMDEGAVAGVGADPDADGGAKAGSLDAVAR